MTLYAAEQRQDPSASSTASAPLADRAWWPWVWLAIASVFLVGTGLVRVWQDRRFEGVEVLSIAPMFPLTEIPTDLQGWTAQEGAEATLDPQVARIAGSTDSLIRNYVDKRTGVVVTVLVLYGRADQVVAHTPEVCYPAIGYQLAENITDAILTIGGTPSRFRSTVYAKQGASLERQEVFYAFRHHGVWSPEVPGNWRKLRNSPAVFKVQVQRRAGDHERRHLFNPTQQFLSAFLPQLEQRIREQEAGGTATPPETSEAPAETKSQPPAKEDAPPPPTDQAKEGPE